jgi:anti-sigma factor RsiW
MGKLLEAYDGPCGRWQDWLDKDSEGSPTLPAQNLSSSLSSEDRAHLQSCDECRVAVEAWLSFRRSLRAVSKNTEAPRWFTARVMAAIARREEESRPIAAWIAIPRLASRLAWVSAVVLAFAGTWIYQKPPAKPTAPASVAASEGLFDTQSPGFSEDDVLISMAEHDRE